MKKVLPFLAMCGLVATANAAVDAPTYMASDFAGAGLTWTTYGVDATVASSFADWFPNYSATNAYNVLVSTDKQYMAMSPSAFTDGSASDQWLITPEFEVPEDEILLTYDGVVYASSLRNNFKVLLSTTGEAKEDFTEELISSSVKGAGNSIFSVERRYVLSGKKGQKVRLAFVNCDNTSGMMGFMDIQAAPYYIKINNAEALNNIVMEKTNPTFSFTLNLTTCDKVKGFTAVLQTASGFESTFTSTKEFVNNKAKAEEVTFSGIDLGDQIYSNYTITITPNYEGAPSTVISGALMMPEMKYDKVAYIEELTGTWCGYCTYGFGLLEYFQDKYTGEGNGLVLGTAVHNGDPMTISELDNTMTAIGQPLGFSGYPSMIVNRETCAHPLEGFDVLPPIMASKSFFKTAIDNVNYDTDSRELTVNYNNTLTFDAEQYPTAAFVMVTQNNMTGKGSSWAQHNYLSGGATESSWVSQGYPADAWPYMEIFFEGGSTVRNLEFQDVARQAYPSLYGETVVADYQADVATPGSFTFKLDNNITDVEEAEVTVVVLNDSGNVIGASRLGYEDWYKDGAAVEEVAEAAVSVAGAHNAVLVDAPAAGVAEVYTADGRLVARANVTAGYNKVNVNANGVVIVKVVAGDKAASAKVIVK